MNNLAYGNIDLVDASYSRPDGTLVQMDCTTDGNGIIMDSNNHWDSDNVPYTAKTLIFGNASFGNGARGIAIFESNNITVVNNTTYYNLQDPNLCSRASQGELSAVDSDNIDYYNNLAFSAGVGYAIVDQNTTGNLYHDNMIDGAGYSFSNSITWTSDSSNKAGIDPLFVAPATDTTYPAKAGDLPTVIYPPTADFKLQSASAARHIGEPFSTVQTDMGLETVQPDTAVDLGALFGN
jgi:hypothetical protein